MRALSKRDVREFYRRLAETRPIPQTELEFINPFTLLVAVVLSAQATDTGVNKATPRSSRWPIRRPKMLALGEERVRESINTIGLFRTKAKNVIALSRIWSSNTAAKCRATVRRWKRCPASAARPRTWC